MDFDDLRKKEGFSVRQEVIQKAPEQPKKQTPNLTGIPTQMKLDFERRSGLSFDDVRVHYNSDKPRKIGALAYTQIPQVHIGPGQERHLRHELGHVVQQKRGIVRPTGIEHGMAVNRSPELEHSADMGTVPQGGGNMAEAVIQCGGCLSCGRSRKRKKRSEVPINPFAEVTDRTGKSTCHAYTLSLLMATKETPENFTTALNRVGKAILKAVEDFLFFCPTPYPNGKGVSFDISKIYDIAIQAGLAKTIQGEEFSKQAQLGQILLMYEGESPRLNTTHSMVISGVDEVTGVNNVSSIGEAGSKDLGPFGVNRIQSFSNFSERMYKPESGQGGWATATKAPTIAKTKGEAEDRKDAKGKDAIKCLLSGGFSKVAILPVVGEEPSDVEKKIRDFENRMFKFFLTAYCKIPYFTIEDVCGGEDEYGKKRQNPEGVLEDYDDAQIVDV